MGDKSLIKKSIQKWNKLSLDIKTTKTSHSFQKKLKGFLHKSHNAIPLKHKIGAFKKYFYVLYYIWEEFKIYTNVIDDYKINVDGYF